MAIHVKEIITDAQAKENTENQGATSVQHSISSVDSRARLKVRGYQLISE